MIAPLLVLITPSSPSITGVRCLHCSLKSAERKLRISYSGNESIMFVHSSASVATQTRSRSSTTRLIGSFLETIKTPGLDRVAMNAAK